MHLVLLLTAEPFPTFDAFERAAKALVERYSGEQSLDPGPQRTNSGWEWREVSSKVGRKRIYTDRSTAARRGISSAVGRWVSPRLVR